MISLEYSFLFVHIPKTGGNSIQNILKDYSEDKIVCLAPHQDGIERFEVRSDKFNIEKHSTLSEYHLQLGTDVLKGLFKFTCVRNPWERMISFYFSPHRGRVTWSKKSFIRLVNRVQPVTDFISMKNGKEARPACFEDIDYYLRYERLNQDFEKACQMIGIPMTTLPLRNVSKHKNYPAYYDDELVDLVRKRFDEEISFFNYKFSE